jgi:hypothetical protein
MDNSIFVTLSTLVVLVVAYWPFTVIGGRKD